MGNTLALKRFSALVIRHVSRSKNPQVVLHKAHQPDLVCDLADADVLSGKNGAQIDLAGADADASASGHGDGEVVEGVLELPDPLVGA